MPITVLKVPSIIILLARFGTYNPAYDSPDKYQLFNSYSGYFFLNESNAARLSEADFKSLEARSETDVQIGM